MRLPDGAASRALLIGTADYAHLPKVPASLKNALALQAALQRHAGLPEEHCRILLDAPGLPAVGRAVAAATAEADDLLLVYYSGHGFIGPDDKLYLTLPQTSESLLPWTGIPFEFLHDALRNAPASTRVLILDCCYSGRATETLGAEERTILGQIRIGGTFTLTSSPANSVSYAPKGSAHTAFTGALLDLLESGSADAGELLTLHDLYMGLTRTARERGLPLPQRLGTHTADMLSLARNRYHDKRSSSVDVSIPASAPAGYFAARADDPPVVTADEVYEVLFHTVSNVVGYNESEVDDFLDKVILALRQPVAGPQLMLPEDIRNARFSTTGPKQAEVPGVVTRRPTTGYDEGEVDVFLDRVELEFERRRSLNEQLGRAV
ncbi:caspase, EACC1-associated type [Glycomyces harbinensis]|uniref:DivIVA domain-containing protein n=1 Tax=Glycomyces harbinensis TaxID=58114 RepID=A0A1G7BXF0_9ACTN|nr:DivIVA domain-containing protein [Glycomyces harbinensis]SDE31778.1 DivIVA domain-containing protein [Glycomyces harbinensis]